MMLAAVSERMAGDAYRFREHPKRWYKNVTDGKQGEKTKREKEKAERKMNPQQT